MHIPSFHAAHITAVAQASTHALSDPLRWTKHGTLRSCRFRTRPPTSAGRAFPGASPYLKHAYGLLPQSRRPTSGRYTLRAVRSTHTLPLRWCMLTQAAGGSTAVVLASRRRSVETVRPRRNMLSLPWEGEALGPFTDIPVSPDATCGSVRTGTPTGTTRTRHATRDTRTRNANATSSTLRVTRVTQPRPRGGCGGGMRMASENGLVPRGEGMSVVYGRRCTRRLRPVPVSTPAA